MVALITVIGAGWAMAQESTTGGTSASQGEGVNVIREKGARYKLVYPVKNAEIVWVRIYDAQKHLLLTEKVRNREGFMQDYDFSNLADGIYTINIQSRSGETVKEVYHSYQRDDIDVSVQRSPLNNSFQLVVKGVEKDPVYVDILDNHQDIIFSDIVDVGKSFTKVYKFGYELPKNMSVRVYSSDQSVMKEIK